MPVKRFASFIRDFVVKGRIRKRKEQILDPEQRDLLFAEARVLGHAITNKRKIAQAMQTMRAVLRSDIALMKKAKEFDNKGLEEAVRKHALVVISEINRLYKISLSISKRTQTKKQPIQPRDTVREVMEEFQKQSIPIKTKTFSRENVILSRILAALGKNKPKKKH